MSDPLSRVTTRFFDDLPRNPSASRKRLEQRGPNQGDAREAASLLFAEFPFPDRRLDDRRFQRADMTRRLRCSSNGTANATRRQALPQLHEVFAGRDQRKLSFLDIGCGTGRFLNSLKQAWPRLLAFGLNMSEPYVRYARRHLKRWSRINLAVGKAEALPARDESQDAVTSIFMFHELPPRVRRIVFRECARVLKPGGRLAPCKVAPQRGDQPDYEGLLELFPQNYHEPYYRSWALAS